MFGFEHGFMGSGGDRVIEVGGHAGPLGILCVVLALILWAVVVTTLVLVIINLVRRLRSPRTEPAPFTSQLVPTQRPLVQPAVTQPPATQPDLADDQSDALRILQGRYARGEINQKEYLARKGDLTSLS